MQWEPPPPLCRRLGVLIFEPSAISVDLHIKKALLLSVRVVILMQKTRAKVMVFVCCDNVFVWKVLAFGTNFFMEF